MDRIRSMMGVCPQFDVLWNELTGVEHLTIYGNIKVGFGSILYASCHQFCCIYCCMMAMCSHFNVL